MNKITGKVKYFNPTDYHGKIEVEGQVKDIYFNTQEINEDAVYLLKGEDVQFELVAGKQSESFEAKKITRINNRFTGIVIDYDDGKGKVKCDQNNFECSIFYKDFVDINFEPLPQSFFITIESGDIIEFEIDETNTFEKKAINIFSDGRKPLIRFAKLLNWDVKIVHLANLSPEPWDYLNSEPENRTLPVLSNYLLYTFSRLKKEEKLYQEKRIVYAKTIVSFKDIDSKKTYKKETECSCFNTGLATQYQEEIFAYFLKNDTKKTKIDPDWALIRFCKSSDPEMRAFEVKPEWANYFRELKDKSEILYDTSLHHELKYEHILRDKRGRFPDELKSLPDSVLQDLLDKGLDKARQRVRRNYKAAIPHYYNGKIQLLLPLCLLSHDKADLALAVEKDGKRYISRTVLKLDWAYSNARLLAKPDREWLNPVKDADMSLLGDNVEDIEELNEGEGILEKSNLLKKVTKNI